MNISRGLYEVLISERITLEEKVEALEKFSLPVHYLDGEYEGMDELGEITKEDADMLIEALKSGNLRLNHS